ncbi:phosphate acyltransferase PlsX [Alphaproteobacteria bacterium]|nr:phosphate acyltransferase PlsX [Alphaproteobacteria bacterium]
MKENIINLDLHGGDFAPNSVLKGAIIAKLKYPHIKFQLHATNECYKEYKKKYPDFFDISTWIEADNHISSEMKPSDALKKDFRKSSMSNAINQLKNDKSQIIISAGNTGAMMAYSTVYLRTVENITRPAITSLFPSKRHPVCFLDLGANSECTSENLVDFAIMGSTYYQALYPEIECKVSLLNIGSEELKGNSLIQETHELLKNDVRFKYTGFIEANNITDTKNHVIVTDGFSGNIALKTAEGVSKFITESLKKSLKSSLYSKILSLMLKNKFVDFRNSIDPRNYNGGIFLGVNGIVIKSHGNADSHAFANAIEFGVKAIESDLLTKIKNNVSR